MYLFEIILVVIVVIVVVVLVVVVVVVTDYYCWLLLDYCFMLKHWISFCRWGKNWFYFFVRRSLQERDLLRLYWLVTLPHSQSQLEYNVTTVEHLVLLQSDMTLGNQPSRTLYGVQQQPVGNERMTMQDVLDLRLHSLSNALLTIIEQSLLSIIRSSTFPPQTAEKRFET